MSRVALWRLRATSEYLKIPGKIFKIFLYAGGVFREGVEGLYDSQKFFLRALTKGRDLLL